MPKTTITTRNIAYSRYSFEINAPEGQATLSHSYNTWTADANAQFYLIVGDQTIPSRQIGSKSERSVYIASIMTSEYVAHATLVFNGDVKIEIKDPRNVQEDMHTLPEFVLLSNEIMSLLTYIRDRDGSMPEHAYCRSYKLEINDKLYYISSIDPDQGKLSTCLIDKSEKRWIYGMRISLERARRILKELKALASKYRT